MICDPRPSDQADDVPGTSAAEKGTTRAAFALFLVGAALLLGAGAVWGVFRLRQMLFLDNPAYRVRTVEVTNLVGLTTQDEVRRQLDLSDRDLLKGINLYAIDLTAQRRAFLRDHPGIEGFSLKRYPPDRLVIDLQERFPVARLGHGGLVVDDQGAVFTLPPSRESLADTLPMLLSEDFAGIRPGARIPEHDLLALDVLRARRRQKKPLSFRIEEVDLTGDVYLDLVTEDNILIQLPPESLASERDIERGLRLAGAVIAAGNASPGCTLTVQPGENGRDSRVKLH